MATNLPEPSSTCSPPPQSAVSVVWPPHTQTDGDVDYESEGDVVEKYEEQKHYVDGGSSSKNIVQYKQQNNTGSDDHYSSVQMSTLPTYTDVNKGSGSSPAGTSITNEQKHFTSQNHMIQDAVMISQIQPFSSNSHSPIISQASTSTLSAAGEVDNLVTSQNGIPQHHSSSETSIDRVPITVEQLVLQHGNSDAHSAANISLPLVIDRTNLAAIMATPQPDGSIPLEVSNFQRLSFSTSHLIQQNTLLNNTQQQLAISDEVNSLSSNLMSPVLSQREMLVSMIPLATTLPSTSHDMVSAYPVNHKHVLAQKYAEKLEKSASSSFSTDLVEHNQYIVETEITDNRAPAHYAVTSGISVLMDSQAVAKYPTHQSVSTSSSQNFTVEGYTVERGLALVSSSQESHEELMEDVHHYATTFNSEPHGNTSVHSFVSSTVDLVSTENLDSIPVDSTVDSKLNSSEDDMVDSTNSYEEQVNPPTSNLCDTEISEEIPTMNNENHPDSTHNSMEMTVSTASLTMLCGPSTSSKADMYCDTVRSRRDVNRTSYWCKECDQFKEKECACHVVRLIVDKPVLSRAWASLPATYLYLHRIVDANNESEYGVFAKKTIPKRTQFGPIEGVLVKTEKRPNNRFLLIVEHNEDHTVYLDTSEESRSNWMRFVRPAESYCQQNLVLVQQGQSLYFNTTRAINPRTELRVWYSPSYAESWCLPLLEMPEEETRDEIEENAWPCFECNKQFPTSLELQKHLNQHDDEEPPKPVVTRGRGRGRGRGRPPKGGYYHHQKCKPVSETTDQEVVGEPVVRRGTRGRPRKKVASEEVITQALPQTHKRPRGRPPKNPELTAKHEEFECEICHKVFPRNYSLQRHMIMHTGEKRFKCPICDMKFSHVYNRNRHVRRHRQRGETEGIPRSLRTLPKRRENRMWACSNCPLVFDNSKILNLHSEIHDSTEAQQEENDSNRTNSKATSRIKENEINNLVENVTKCPKCKKPFTDKKALCEHVAIHGKTYSKVISVKGLINPQKPYKCNLCYKSFATDERLMRHYLVHGSDESKPLQCDVCLKRFLNNSALACHIKVHNEDRKTYECPMCKQNFDQMIGLKEHVHSHSENGVFTCPHCQKRCEEYNQIRKHIRAFHSDKRYPCEKCDKVFPRPDKLKLHMLRHSNHREFLCADCGKQFKRKDKLKEHMKRMHGPDRDARTNSRALKERTTKKFVPKVSPTDYHRFIYKCHTCLLGFKRRGMLVNHLARRHPDIRPESVPELNLPILKTTRDYYCQYCEKIYKSSSKRKAHILKNHPGAELPMSNRQKGGIPEIPGLPNPTFSQTVGSITTHPHHCNWCHKQYASKAKLLQHQRKKHLEMLALSYATSKNQHSVPELSPERECPLTGHIVITQSIPSSMASSLTADGAIIIDATKRKPQFADREGSPTADTLPSADLLTQAMSELTQSLNEYRPAGSEYLAARISQSSPTTLIIPSSVQSSQPATLVSSTTVITTHTYTDTSVITPITTESTSSAEEPQTITTAVLDNVQLAQLLAQYQQQPFSILATLLRNPSTQTVTSTTAVTTDTVTTTTSNVSSPRTWPATTGTFTEYPAR